MSTAQAAHENLPSVVVDPPRRRSREKTREELQFAMLRVKNSGLRMSITAVAAEAGLTPALIHNTYPDIAEAIRAHAGRSTRQQRDAKTAELAQARAALRELREQLEHALADIAKLASINAALSDQVHRLGDQRHGKVVALHPRKRLT